MGSVQPFHEAGSYKILVVEDNPNDRALYKRLLSKSNTAFDILEAASVSDGLAISRTKDIDCILLDYRLPDADGIDFIKSCKKDGLVPDAAIVMVTGQGDEQTAVEAMKLGALDYIAKDTIIDGFFVQNILNAIERAHLKRQVRQYQQELEKSYLSLSEFTHTVSHDLKAPLRRIIQYCDLLKEEKSGMFDEDGADYINRLRVNAYRMQRLIDDLLIYSHTINAKEEKKEIDLNKVVSDIVDEFGELIEENNATVTVENLPTVTVYPVRIKELFQNLIENALKYRNEKDPAVIISCKEEGKNFTFSVSDNGEGINEKHHETIFRAFERLHTQDEIEGSGLGLSICSKAVEMHGGKMWVESKTGEGATFKFTIPQK